MALSHIHLLASLIHPYMPDTTTAILAQLNATFLTIPDEWEASSLPVGHKIGKAAYLFSQIKPEREQEWREQFGGEEARKAKDEKAAKAAAKKAEKERKKAKKAADKVGEGVEASEKGGKGKIPAEKTAVEEVAEGVKQTSLQSS
jgi:methionyl-tRNA synthetase